MTNLDILYSRSYMACHKLIQSKIIHAHAIHTVICKLNKALQKVTKSNSMVFAEHWQMLFYCLNATHIITKLNAFVDKLNTKATEVTYSLNT